MFVGVEIYLFEDIDLFFEFFEFDMLEMILCEEICM